jgi:hypothetical protein
MAAPVLLESDPTAVAVYLGDRFKGTTPLQLTIPVGQAWDLTLSRDDLLPTTVSVRAGIKPSVVRLNPATVEVPAGTSGAAESGAKVDPKPAIKARRQPTASAEGTAEVKSQPETKEPAEEEPEEEETPEPAASEATPKRPGSDLRDPWAD